MTARLPADRTLEEPLCDETPSAVVLCSDERLWRFLEIELNSLGLQVIGHPTWAMEDLTSVVSKIGRARPSLVILNTDHIPLGEGALEEWLSATSDGGCAVLAFGREAPAGLPQDSIFLLRPFDLAELEDTLRALTADFSTRRDRDLSMMRPTVSRRGDVHGTASRTDGHPTLFLDEARGEAVVGAHRVALTKTEVALLRLLLTSAGTAVPRSTLAAAVSGGGNTVDVYVCHLRAKIEKPLGRRMIRTVRGVGYVLA